MKTKYSLFLSLVLLALAGGCTNNFENINSNPNQPPVDAATPELLLSPVLKDGTMLAEEHQRIHNIFWDMFAQYYVGGSAWSSDQYNLNNGFVELYWRNQYSRMNILNTIIRINKDKDSENNVYNVARIWKVYLTQQCTDIFGDIPDSTAANGTEDLPTYDTQASIYKKMLTELASASSELKSGGVPLGVGDYIYQGDITKWKLFANSLRLRVAMRIANVAPDLAKQNAEAAIAAGVIENISDMPRMVNTGSPWGYGYSTNYYFGWGAGNGCAMSEAMYNVTVNLGNAPFPAASYFKDKKGNPLTLLNKVPAIVDPRAPIFFSTTDQESACDSADYAGNWTGIKTGLNATELTDPKFQVANNSRVGPAIWKDITRPYIIMPASEVWFLRAEAAEKFGWNAGVSAQTAYENGVTSSFQQWDLNSSSYLASSGKNSYGVSPKWGDGNGSNLNKIYTQKWLGGFPDNGMEAWADQRRGAAPFLIAPAFVYSTSGVASGSFIQRIKYPETQYKLNPTGVATANTHQGTDNCATKLWWAK